MQTENSNVTGGCLCGGIRYAINGPLRPVINCHCTQCRRTSGHFVAATAADRKHLTLVNDSGLRWYYSSNIARRGFCHTCGSSLFWDPTDDESSHISIMAGTLDGPMGLETKANIYTDDVGDYYKLDEDIPQLPQGGYGL